MGRLARGAVVLLTTALSVLFGLGCVVAALFEVQGFGATEDQEPRPLYLAALTVGFVMCVAAPFVAMRMYDRMARSPDD